MRIITIARKPLSESTVASNVLKHGCGGINVDGCRIKTSDLLGRSSAGWCREAGYTTRPQYVGGESPQWDSIGTTHEGGRWPANLILIHKAGCECVGTKRVKGISGGRSSGDNAFFGSSSNRPTAIVRKDGKETVEDWNCEEGCPVRKLGEQGGILKSGLLKSKHKGFGNHGIYGKAEVEVYHPTYGDIGSAARFFKQIKDS